jgi:hypothetical protein
MKNKEDDSQKDDTNRRQSEKFRGGPIGSGFSVFAPMLFP